MDEMFRLPPAMSYNLPQGGAPESPSPLRVHTPHYMQSYGQNSSAIPVLQAVQPLVPPGPQSTPHPHTPSPQQPHYGHWSPGFSPMSGSPSDFASVQRQEAQIAWQQQQYIQAQAQAQVQYHAHVHSQWRNNAGPLHNANASSNPAPVTRPGTRKRANNATQSGRNVRARNQNFDPSTVNPTTTASVCGSGPIPSASEGSTPRPPPPQHPAQQSEIFRSAMEREARSNSGASDVWFFIAPANSRDASTFPKRTYKECPDVAAGKWLICKECKHGDRRRGAWKNGTSNTTNIRTHLTVHHPDEYDNCVLKYKLKGWEALAAGNHIRTSPSVSSSRREGEPFSVERFYELLVRWIVVDDQALNVVDCQELRDLLLYVGAELEDNMIPHRTKLTELIFKQFDIEFKIMAEELQHSLGRISFTSDMWSRGILQGFMAITAHYMIYVDGHLVMRSRIIGFRYVGGAHSGENMAKYFFSVLEELGIEDRIGMITLDNAANNGTMMRSLERHFKSKNIPFSHNGNRIRCFPHVINIAVKTGLARLGIYDLDDDDKVTWEHIHEIDPEPAQMSQAYMDALATDLVDSARKLVNACRASGRRRDALREAIIDRRKAQASNSTGPASTDNSILMRVVVLLRDVDTRWSSTFMMIDRLLELYPAVKSLALQEEHKELEPLLLRDFDLGVLHDIRQFLKSFHLVQELASAQKTPCLAIVLPIYEHLIVILNSLKTALPNLAHAISSSLAKLHEYLDKSRSTHMYALAMFINPTSKLMWIEKNWADNDVIKSREAIQKFLLEHQTAIRKACGAPGRVVREAPGSDAARAQASGLAALREFSASISDLSRSSSHSSLQSEADTDPEITLTDEEVEAQALEADEEAVKDELARWNSEGIITDAAKLESFDLIRFWDNEAIQKSFPSIFRLALDVLPVQASAVACERAFSSSKETDSDRRSRMSPVLMEVLQILKSLYRADRLDFSKSWVARSSDMAEEDSNGACTMESMSVVDISPDEIRQLLVNGKVADATSLIVESFKVA